MTTVGLPLALLYYRYGQMWQAFFDALGMEVVVSPPTTGEMLRQGAARVVPETCLPVKIYCGHVLWLLGRVDFIFVPSIHALRPLTRNCPKLIGLPDLVADVIPDAPLLTVDIEDESLWPRLIQLAARIYPYSLVSPLALRRAVKRARAAHEAQQPSLLPDTRAPEPEAQQAPGSLAVGVVGHPYNLHDGYATHRLLARLRRLGIRVLTSDRVQPAERRRGVAECVEAPYWTFEDEIVGASHVLLQRNVDGLLSVSAFGCAPDSVMISVLAQAARRAGTPYMSLILDEHSGEAGLVTRLEAFADMLLRRREKG